MDITVIAFLALLVAVAALRIVELQISRRHQQSMIARGASKVTEPRFGWMVALHTAVLVGAAVEVVFLHRPFIPILAAVSFAVFLAANAVRWWVIRTLGRALERAGDGLHTAGRDCIWTFSLRSAS